MLGEMVRPHLAEIKKGGIYLAHTFVLLPMHAFMFYLHIYNAMH